MGEAAPAGQQKVIVIPRGLEEFFYDRLCQRYSNRPDVKIVVDRRWGERRALQEAVFPDRRRRDRRAMAASWSLADMPFTTSAS
jgi:hypothetical protein